MSLQRRIVIMILFAFFATLLYFFIQGTRQSVGDRQIMEANELLWNTTPIVSSVTVYDEQGHEQPVLPMKSDRQLYCEVTGEFNFGEGKKLAGYVREAKIIAVRIEQVKEQKIVWRTHPTSIEFEGDRFHFRVPNFAMPDLQPGEYNIVVSYANQERKRTKTRVLP